MVESLDPAESWLASVEPRVRSGLLLALGVAVVATVGWALTRSGAPPPVEDLLPRVSDAQPSPSVTGTAAVVSSTAAPVVVVHVAGSVADPGLYELGAGPRVADAVAAAGGLTGDADIDRINLAAPVSDGERVFIPAVGDAEIPPVAGVAGAAVGAAGSLSDPAGVALVDINAADAAGLESLPGVGPATAAAIVAHREANGPFRSIEGLLDVRGIGPAKLEQIRPHVTVSGS